MNIANRIRINRRAYENRYEYKSSGKYNNGSMVYNIIDLDTNLVVDVISCYNNSTTELLQAHIYAINITNRFNLDRLMYLHEIEKYINEGVV